MSAKGAAAVPVAPDFLTAYGTIIGGTFIGVAVIGLFAVLAKIYFHQQSIGSRLNSITAVPAGELAAAQAEAAHAQAALDRLRTSLGAAEQNNRLLNDQIDVSQSTLSALNEDRKGVEDQFAGMTTKEKKRAKRKLEKERKKKEKLLDAPRGKGKKNQDMLDQIQSQQDTTISGVRSSISKMQQLDNGLAEETAQLKHEIKALNDTVAELVEEHRNSKVNPADTAAAAGDAPPGEEAINAIDEDDDDDDDAPKKGCCGCGRKKKGSLGDTSVDGQSRLTGHPSRGSKATGGPPGSKAARGSTTASGKAIEGGEITIDVPPPPVPVV